MQKRILILLAMLTGAWPFLLAQELPVDSFPVKKAQHILELLASDAARGRGNFTKDLEAAGDLIATEFREAGLKPLPATGTFFHAFQPDGGPVEQDRDLLEWNGNLLPQENFIYLHHKPGVYPAKDLASFNVIRVDSFTNDMLTQYATDGRDLLFWTTDSPDRNDWANINLPSSGMIASRLLVVAGQAPETINLQPREAYYRSVLYNIAGILPGKTRPAECIIFSAHYDHTGVEKGRDSIMNGANDNASGTTALILLAQYFAARNDNARTLIFCAFAGEEIGLKGSKAITEMLAMDKIKAGINLEMLGYPQYGKKKVYITGERYSSLGSILRKGMSRNGLKVMREPDEEKRLFARSDNYPFFNKGVPFHTIMASDDDEPCYHRPCDEIRRMDTENLCFIARAIAYASQGLISGAETPGKIRHPDWED